MEEDENGIMVVFFIFVSLILGQALKKVSITFSLPYSPLLFLVGLFCGKYYQNLGLYGQSCFLISSIDPHAILLIFLPVFIYESGFNFDWHLFKRQFA